MNSKKIILEAKQVRYYSHTDEFLFFEWLKKIRCIENYQGQGNILYLNVNISKVDDNCLREILALFERYHIEMQQLSIFKNELNRDWFLNPQAYWFKKVFTREY